MQVALHSCLTRNEADRVVQLLAHWYRVPVDEVVVARELLIQCPFHSDGYLSLVEGAQIHVKGDPQDRLVALTNASNLFLGTYHSVTGASAEPPHMPVRPGVVDESAGEHFELRLSETYLPADLTSKDRVFTGQIVIPSKGHPIQAIQIRNGIRCAPIVASLRKPHQDRKVQRVAIWSGAGSMTEEIERNAVAETFQRSGVEVLVVSPDDANVNKFLDLYAADHFDVIWLMSHGIFDHTSPKRASLMVDEQGGKVNIEGLLKLTPTGPNRRLLVLNVCDGGRFEELGVLPRVGVAPSAASASQATISHLWPVHGLSAAVFGALLAKHLVSHQSYFEAFTQTLMDLRSNKEGIVALMRESSGANLEQLAERIERTNVDMANLAHWGSAVFYC